MDNKEQLTVYGTIKFDWMRLGKYFSFKLWRERDLLWMHPIRNSTTLHQDCRRLLRRLTGFRKLQFLVLQLTAVFSVAFVKCHT